MGLDPYNLARFTAAQNGVYERALAEIRRGRKASHWMWFIFPMMIDLATSTRSRKYAIYSIEEARAYLAHPVLGPRLLEISQAVLESNTRTAFALMGPPDDQKLRSCVMLFKLVSVGESVFDGVLKKYYRGVEDPGTLDIWNRLRTSAP